MRRIIEARISCYRASSWRGLPEFLGSFEDEGARALIAEAAAESRRIADPAKILKGDPNLADKRGILGQLRDEFIDQQMAALMLRVNRPETSEAERLDLLRQKEQLRLQKRQPL